MKSKLFSAFTWFAGYAIFLALLSLFARCAFAQTPTNDPVKQVAWMTEVNELLCAKVNACHGVERDSLTHPYAYTYMCCSEEGNRFYCDDACQFGTAGIIPFFYYTGLTPNEAVEKMIALKTAFE